MEKINTILWDELLDMPVKHPILEFAGFLDALPFVLYNDRIVYACHKLAAMRRILKLRRGLKEEAFNATITGEEGALELDKKRGKARFSISIDRYREMRIAASRYVKEDRWIWFRGVWGAAGSLYLPQNGYHMVLSIVDRDNLGNRIAEMLKHAKIVPTVRVKHNRTEYTVRSQEQIVTCLSNMGLVKSLLMLEDTAIMRSLRDMANKLVNCDSANIGKSLSAAREQLSLIAQLDDRMLWNCLPPNLSELAHVRRANPSVSLRELGQMLSKPVSKSTVEYRWRKLDALIKGM